MLKKSQFWFVAGLLCLSILSCKRMDRPFTMPAGAFQFEPRSGGATIPLDYGDLVSVIPVEGRPYEAMLWFMQTNDTIVGVRINVARGTVSDQVLMIPRR